MGSCGDAGGCKTDCYALVACAAEYAACGGNDGADAAGFGDEAFCADVGVEAF